MDDPSDSDTAAEGSRESDSLGDLGDPGGRDQDSTAKDAKDAKSGEPGPEPDVDESDEFELVSDELTPLELLSLAYPLGVAWFVIGFGTMFASGVVFAVAFARMLAETFGADGALQGSGLLVMVFVVAMINVALAFGVTRGHSAARFLLGGIGVLQLGWTARQMILGARPQALGLIVGIACALLMLPVFNRWFTKAERDRLRAPEVKPYTMAVTWLAVWAGLLLSAAPGFMKMFQETGLELSLLAEIPVNASRWLTDYSLFVYPLAIALPLPLLWTKPELRKPAEYGLLGVGFVGLSIFGLGLVLPIFEMIEKL